MTSSTTTFETLSSARRAQVAKGMALMITAMLMLPIMDGLAKSLAIHYQVTAGQTTFGRFLVQAALLGPVVVVLYGWKALKPQQLWFNLLRGAIMSVAVMVFFTSLRYMPIADALAVFFLEPFILTVLSVIVLKERVGWRRSLAVGLGFCGAMFIVQPSYQVFGPVSLLPIGTAFLFATYLIITSKVAAKDNAVTMQFIAGIGGVVTLGVIIAVSTRMGWENFSSPEVPEFGIRWFLIFCIGALATVGHLLVVFAFRLASASVLAPFQYVEIVTGTMIGYWVFGDFPDAWKWIGIAIIVGSGIYLFFRERHMAGK